MIVRSRAMAVACLAGAFGLHAAGVFNADLDNPAMEEGGPGAAIAQLGNSFADMTAGVVSAQVVEETPEVPDPELTSLETQEPETPESAEAPVPEEQAPVQPNDPVPTLKTTETTPQQKPDQHVAEQPSDPLPPLETQPESGLTPAPTMPLALTPTVALAAAPEPALVVPPALVPTTQTMTAPPPADIIPAAPDEDMEGAISKRPRARSREFEKLHRQKPDPKVTKKPRKSTRKKAKPNPQKRGSNAKQTANRGSTSGQLNAKAAQQGVGNNRSKKKNGNAAVTNYPGKVRRCVNRGSRARGAGRGTAVVAFRVAGSGQLTNISLARGSGNAKLDRIAVQAIKRVGRCPAPPPGARRSYSIKVIGK